MSPLIAQTEAAAGGEVNLLQAVVLGFVQGITEFLPISSTAHLLVFTRVFGWDVLGEKYFVDAIQFGSVIAVLIYFWSDIQQTIAGSWMAFRKKNWEQDEWKVFVGIAIGTVPALVGGLFYKKALPGVTQSVLEGALVIAFMSIMMSLLMGLAEKIGSRKRGFNLLEIKDGILVGLGQMLAIIPGTSRSGSTMTMALFLGLERPAAARFSFLLGLPTLAIATLYQSTEVRNHLDVLPALIVGIISTFIFSYLSIAWLIRFLQRQSTWIFVWYRLAFGLSLLLAIANGRLAGT
ncbi:MAG: undecaprenyl-diphosphate phosphatase [Leptolyngbyaceae cyanobacterium RM2_2_4]|nr:undecaprenyl-diphosphate phosphatase [Leptolyngbyaceae cyanobacterium SM1_4_3]NJN90234.1 undecaprenyl-diphosphate phosphatase [Leptolyngbyaceae cyanobacterium SL_5_14]NJO50206.1 undecaprenyl-diphosphate phosphatase [Leptolyngbyaceae cyanobacterium RM2_2_4]